MRNVTLVWLFASVVVAGTATCVVPASGEPGKDAASMFVKEVPPGYRDWRFVSLAREEGSLDDIRVILGNDAAIGAYRAGRLPFPEGTILARLAYSYDASEENDEAFGRRQSYVAGHPKNGLQFMLKNSKKYAATGGWGYGQFEAGRSLDDSMLGSCFPCHQKVAARDFVFTRYAP